MRLGCHALPACDVSKHFAKLGLFVLFVSLFPVFKLINHVEKRYNVNRMNGVIMTDTHPFIYDVTYLF